MILLSKIQIIAWSVHQTAVSGWLQLTQMQASERPFYSEGYSHHKTGQWTGYMLDVRCPGPLMCASCRSKLYNMLEFHVIKLPSEQLFTFGQ